MSHSEDVHVVPTFGKAHLLSSSCWCQPKADQRTLDRSQYAVTLWVHNLLS